jgi:hypothetical protein
MITVVHRAAVAAGLLLCAVGCQKTTLPKTYPAAGSVKFKDGRPLTGGIVQFQSADRSLTVSGTIGADGTFSLQTLKETTQVPGAPEGSYTVTVLPPVASDRRLPFQPVTLPQPYKVEAGPKNEFAIEIDTPPP